MTWTYGGDPSGNEIDEVRLLIGDTDTNNQMFSNEELQYYIDTYGSGVPAAIAAIKGAIAKYSRYTDEKTGEIEVKWSQQIKNWTTLLEELTGVSSSSSVPMPFGGGISKVDVSNRNEDSDRVPDVFSVGIDDNNGSET